MLWLFNCFEHYFDVLDGNLFATFCFLLQIVPAGLFQRVVKKCGSVKSSREIVGVADAKFQPHPFYKNGKELRIMFVKFKEADLLRTLQTRIFIKFGNEKTCIKPTSNIIEWKIEQEWKHFGTRSNLFIAWKRSIVTGTYQKCSSRIKWRRWHDIKYEWEHICTWSSLSNVHHSSMNFYRKQKTRLLKNIS